MVTRASRLASANSQEAGSQEIEYDSPQAELDARRQKVDVDSYDLTVRELDRMCAEGELDIAPEYQRKFRWTAADESRLIESLFLGLPIPPLYFAVNRDGSWEVVDGLQRLSSAIHFLGDAEGGLRVVDRANPLILSGLTELATFNGLAFADLPPAVRLAFPRRTFQVIALSDKSRHDVRFDLFERLNKGGISLSPQEVRSCIFRGSFEQYLDRLSKQEGFGELLKLQKSRQNDGTREEVVLKYFAYTFARDRFKGKVTDFLNSFMERETASPSLDRTEEGRIFSDVCAHVRDVGGAPLLRENVHTTPLNEAEAVLVAAGELLRHGVPFAKPPEGWLDDPQLVACSTGATNTRANLLGRIRRAAELLSGKSVPELVDAGLGQLGQP